MLNRHHLRNRWYYISILIFILACPAISKNKEIARINNDDLQISPKVYYTIDCSIDLAEGILEGTENIRFKNTTSEPMSRFEIRWIPGGDMEITSKGKEIKILDGTDDQSQSSSTSIDFLEAIGPGETAVLQIKFNILVPAYKGIDKIAAGRWYPHLWRGFETHGDYEVKLSVPEEYTVATSGLLNKETGYYHAENVRSFGLFLGKGFDSIEANAEDVHIRCIFPPKGKKCAELLLKTAVDVIGYYRERFGFYPSKCLTIIPGMNRPAGGYPLATNIVGVHGMVQLDSMPKFHWQWITAHEIGHQYCGEHILSKDPKDPFDWLMIGLGIYADREYTQARNLSSAKHQGLMDRYIKGVRKSFDTTINITPEQRSKIKFDFNNVVEHGKSYSVISALDCVLGKETFSRIYQRCLDEFGGRRLGISEFQTVCEEESGQNLEWFFDQWVNSNKFLSYEISSQKCDKLGNSYKSKIEVKCLGNLKMPVPVAAYFEDGSSQVKSTNRLSDTDVLEFESSSPLKEVRLDPANKLAMVIPPPSVESKVLGEAQIFFPDKLTELFRRFNNLPWTDAGPEILEVYKGTTSLDKVKRIEDGLGWFHLGLKLVGSGYFRQAMDAFERAEGFLKDQGGSNYFADIVWQGHMYDVFGKRDKAKAKYRQALEVENLGTMRYDQWKMILTKEWVQVRLDEPFTKEMVGQ